MARETTIRGRSAPPAHDALRGLGLTGLRPTWRGLAAAVVAITLAVVAVATEDWGLLLIVAVVALPLAIAPFVVLERAHRAAGAEVHMMIAPPLVPVGAPCELLVQLTHSGGSNLPAVSLERPLDRRRLAIPGVPPSIGTAWVSVTLAPEIGRLIRWDELGPDESASSTLALPTRRRGVFTIGSLRLWVHDPFGLFGLTVAVARPVTLVVHPVATVAMASPAVRPGTSGSTQFSDGPTAIHTDDPGGEWSGLRPYEPGDRLHLLSWQAEARFGALLVHDFRPDSEDVVTIVFDDRTGVHRRQAFENALGTLFGLASAAEGHATDYDVSTLSGRRVRGSTTPDGLVPLLTFLAETQPTRAGRHLGPSASTLSDGALLITTPTAVSTLPPSLDRGSIVVIE
jgi:uncharacterized protein (DUF58 family)